MVKANETLAEITVPGTGAFPFLLTVPAAPPILVRRRNQQVARAQDGTLRLPIYHGKN